MGKWNLTEQQVKLRYESPIFKQCIDSYYSNPTSQNVISIFQQLCEVIEKNNNDFQEILKKINNG